MAEDESFLARWSRRKAEQKEAPAENTGAAPPETAPASPPAVPSETTDEPAVDLDSLPDIDSLDVNSDFSVFMQAGVPDALRNRALQKMWRLVPSFSHIDGLLEYAEDVSDAAVASEPIRSIYQVGRGMLQQEDTEKKEEIAIADANPDAGAAEAPPTDPLPAPNEAESVSADSSADASEPPPEAEPFRNRKSTC